MTKTKKIVQQKFQNDFKVVLPLHNMNYPSGFGPSVRHHDPIGEFLVQLVWLLAGMAPFIWSKRELIPLDYIVYLAYSLRGWLGQFFLYVFGLFTISMTNSYVIALPAMQQSHNYLQLVTKYQIKPWIRNTMIFWKDDKFPT